VLRDFSRLEGNNGNSHLKMEINTAVLDCTFPVSTLFAVVACMGSNIMLSRNDWHWECASTM